MRQWAEDPSSTGRCMEVAPSLAFVHDGPCTDRPATQQAATGQRGQDVGELPTPTAKRLQKPSWRDTRLLVGVVLVLLATAVGAKVIGAADDRVAMYAAAQTLKPGDRLTTDNLKPVDVQLGDAGAVYLSATAALAPDRFAVRQVPQGELVPMDAIGSQADVSVQPVTIVVDANSATSLRVGSVVDVWVSERDTATTQERYLDAKLSLERVSVGAVPSDQSRFGAAAASAAVQVLVPRARVQAVIAASDKRSRFTLVPVPGSPSGP